MPKYTLFIDLQDWNLKLSVTDGKKMVGEIELPVERNLDSQLINGLDKLFERNRLSKDSVKKVKITSKIDKNSSQWKVMTAFIKGLHTY